MKITYHIVLLAGFLVNFLPSMAMIEDESIDLQLLEIGPVERMIPLIKKELSLAGISLIFPDPKSRDEVIEKHLMQAARLFARYNMHIIQAVACCVKEDEMDKRMDEHLKYQDFVQAIKRYMLPQELNCICLQEISSIEEQTINNELPDPYWIIKFSWDEDEDIQEKIKKVLIPKDKWNGKRTTVLKNFKDQLKELKN